MSIMIGVIVAILLIILICAISSLVFDLIFERRMSTEVLKYIQVGDKYCYTISSLLGGETSSFIATITNVDKENKIVFVEYSDGSKAHYDIYSFLFYYNYRRIC